MKLSLIILMVWAKMAHTLTWPENCYVECQDNELQIINMVEYDISCEAQFKEYIQLDVPPKIIHEDLACEWKPTVGTIF